MAHFKTQWGFAVKATREPKHKPLPPAHVADDNLEKITIV
jgi:hypothetical protein